MHTVVTDRLKSMLTKTKTSSYSAKYNNVNVEPSPAYEKQSLDQKFETWGPTDL